MRLLQDTLFEDSIRIFQDFLAENHTPTDLVWVFKEDVLLGKSTVLVKASDLNNNVCLAKRLYEIGLQRNFGVCFHAVALLESRTCCFIQLPSDEVEAELLLISTSHLKCSIRNPLMAAKLYTNNFFWNIKKVSHGAFHELPSKDLSFPLA